MARVISVLRALTLLGGRGSVGQIVEKMWLHPREVEERLAVWRSVGAVEASGDQWVLVPLPDEDRPRGPRPSNGPRPGRRGTRRL